MNTNLTTHLRRVIIAILISLSLATVNAQQGNEDTYIKSALAFFNNQQYDQAIEYCNKAISSNPSSSYALNIRGTCYNKKHDYTNAISDFNEAIRLSPGYANAYYNRASAFASQNNYSAALADYSNAILYNGTDKFAYYDRGILKYNQKDFAEAIKDFTSVIAVDPQHTNGYFYRGISNYSLQKYDEAIADYTSVIGLDPKSLYAYYNRGLSYNVKGFKSKAIADFTDAINLDNTYAPAYEQRAKAYNEQKNYTAAISDYSQLLKLNPASADAYFSKGYIYHTTKDYDKAIADYSQHISLTSTPYLSLFNIGLIQYERKDYDKARLNFAKAIQADPKAGDAYVYTGLCYSAQRKFDEAILQYNEALKVDPKNVTAYISRGYTYDLLENFTKAFEDYAEAARLDPKNGYIYLNRGYTYLNVGDYEKAIAEHSKALSIDPRFKEAYVGRGIVQYYSSNWNAALADYSEAIKIDPEFSFAYFSRGAANVFKGEYAKAVADFEQSIKYDSSFSGSYINLLTALTHTGEFDKAKKYLGIYRARNLKRDASTKSWEFYDHYINALMEGVLENSYPKALQELTIAEKMYNANAVTGNKKNETKFGFVDILFLKGHVLEKLDQLQEARAAYEQAYVINQNQHDVKEILNRLDKESTLAINTDKTPPSIEILSPETTRSFDIVSDVTDTKIIGKAVDEGGIKSVTINGQPVSRVEEGGFFIQSIALAEGTNTITVEAIDKNDNKANKSFKLNLKSSPENKAVVPQPTTALIDNTLSYHAILIAEQEYSDPSIPDLANPVSDASELKKILETSYTFEKDNILVLENKSREDILQALIQKCNTLTPNDNLLIFYAGHGTAIIDSTEDKDVEGYFVPVSAKWKNEVTFISASDIKAALRRSKAKHILLIADACYSGAFTRGLPMDASIDIQKQYKLQSRKVMASGNLEPVPDKSEFIKYLKKRLRDNEQAYLPADELFNNFRKAVLVNSSTTPLYAPIQDARDEGGDFVFIKKK